VQETIGKERKQHLHSFLGEPQRTKREKAEGFPEGKTPGFRRRFGKTNEKVPMKWEEKVSTSEEAPRGGELL